MDPSTLAADSCSMYSQARGPPPAFVRVCVCVRKRVRVFALVHPCAPVCAHACARRCLSGPWLTLRSTSVHPGAAGICTLRDQAWSDAAAGLCPYAHLSEQPYELPTAGIETHTHTHTHTHTQTHTRTCLCAGVQVSATMLSTCVCVCVCVCCHTSIIIVLTGQKDVSLPWGGSQISAPLQQGHTQAYTDAFAQCTVTCARARARVRACVHVFALYTHLNPLRSVATSPGLCSL